MSHCIFQDDEQLPQQHHHSKLSKGLDIEIFTFSALKTWTNAKLPSERARAPYIWKNNEYFKRTLIRKISAHGMDSKPPKDLLFFEEIFLKYKNNMSVDFEEVINF